MCTHSCVPGEELRHGELQVTLIVPVNVHQERIYCSEHAGTTCKEQREGMACVSPPLCTNWREPNGLWRMLGESNELKSSVLALKPESLGLGHVLVAEKQSLRLYKYGYINT